MKKKGEENHKQIDENLKNISNMTEEELFEKYETSYNGISIVEVEEKIEKFGKNIIELNKSKGILANIRDAVINPFNIVLIIVAIATFITDIIISKKPTYSTFVLITITIFISAIISFIQQDKSTKEANKLKKMITNKVDVIRDGVDYVIELEDVVPGDIVKLSSGDMIPGDIRFLKTKDLFVDEASITGESVPAEKFEKNIGFMGTNIVSGTALALVISTGMNTYFGSMAKFLTEHNKKTSYENGVNSISKLLIRVMIIIVPIIFLINLFTKGNFVDSLLFGITIAVGLTPEMLPVIMTSTLAKGAVEMSKKKTIVKRLGAIQTFGEMDVLCTDKTGTLTEDEIVLEKYINVTGNEDNRILRHAFLNSYFQTGLKNLIDIAIISRAEKEKMNILKEKYKREDEIPFDFSRRRMSVVLKDDTGKRQLITKGAVDEVMAICSYVEVQGEVLEFSEELRNKAYKIYEENNNNGLRVLAIAQKNEIHGVETFGISDEKNMVLIGFVAFLDPPKESAQTAIKTLSKYGVATVVLTGDSEGVALNVCKKLGIQIKNRLTGREIEKMTDEELREKCEDCHLYSKLSPFQKERIVKAYQQNGHTVGYMGDGINDSPPLKQADVGISVDTAVDIAKEMADIILLEKDLNVLGQGVVSGRKTFMNMSKYIKMATSGNIGNMFSVLIASIFLPFLPLLPIHILIQNLLCDIAQIGMPFDNVDKDELKNPKKIDIKDLKKFMICFGLVSTVLDIACFAVLWFVLGFNTIGQAIYFQTGWFVFGVISQTLIIHMIRTNKMPFIESTPSSKLLLSTLVITIITLIIGLTGVATLFKMVTLPIVYIFWLIILLIIYIIVIQLFKKIYFHKLN